jgi:hypothetical protein
VFLGEVGGEGGREVGKQGVGKDVRGEMGRGLRGNRMGSEGGVIIHSMARLSAVVEGYHSHPDES